MYVPLYLNYPSWIHPEVFPGIPVLGLIRWYGLMYICAFGTAYFILKKLWKEGALDTTGYKATEDELFSFIATGIVFLLIGARIFSTLIYDTSGLYRQKPWLIFWPFDEQHRFTGLAGMSYHGGFIGGLFGIIAWCAWHKKPVLQWMDAMVIAIPLGYTFGRLGNFLNGELYGRITTMPWGMVFPDAQRFSLSIPWVHQLAEKAGLNLTTTATLINLPRHPSQLYEAFFEGFVLWLILWTTHGKKHFPGFSSALYTVGYGCIRFVIEYFREPDADIGYRISHDANAPIYLNTSLANISTGQILCMLMIAGGIILGCTCYFYNKYKLRKTQ
jgi:phosphatidylglycerol---prolipoprotein diacylglyceryl transferase